MDFLYWLTIKLSYTTWVLLLCMSDWWNSSGFIFRHTNACQIECAKFHRTSSRPNDPSALLCVCLSSEVIRVFRNTLDWHDFDKNTYFTHSLIERDQLIQCYVTWCYFLIKKREILTFGSTRTSFRNWKFDLLLASASSSITSQFRSMFLWNYLLHTHIILIRKYGMCLNCNFIMWCLVCFKFIRIQCEFQNQSGKNFRVWI